jgi:hypothetical protein
MKNKPAYKKIRQVWNINPKSRIKESKKNNILTKQEIKRILKMEDF